MKTQPKKELTSDDMCRMNDLMMFLQQLGLKEANPDTFAELRQLVREAHEMLRLENKSK